MSVEFQFHANPDAQEGHGDTTDFMSVEFQFSLLLYASKIYHWLDVGPASISGLASTPKIYFDSPMVFQA
jgi:hypothetical protein